MVLLSLSSYHTLENKHICKCSVFCSGLKYGFLISGAGKRTYKRRTQFCIFCNTGDTNLPRYIFSKRLHKERVQEIQNVSPDNFQKRLLISKLRKEGYVQLSIGGRSLGTKRWEVRVCCLYILWCLLWENYLAQAGCKMYWEETTKKSSVKKLRVWKR